MISSSLGPYHYGSITTGEWQTLPRKFGSLCGNKAFDKKNKDKIAKKQSDYNKKNNVQITEKQAVNDKKV